MIPRLSAGRPLALTMGEPAGIGGELTLRAWAARRDAGPAFFVLDDPARLARLARDLGLGVPVRAVADPAAASALFPEALPVLPLARPVAAVPGRPDPAHAAAVVESIERAVALVRDGAAAAVVTNPIQKATLYAAGFKHPGHTEYLAALAGGGAEAVMMLACPGLRVIPVTVHIPLARVPADLTAARILHCGRVAAAALRRDFGIDRPRLAVAGLNPHAGEDGGLGREDLEIVAPAVEALAAAGIESGFTVRGPLPADTMFHAAARARYDVALCMYHDQALIPVKTIDFENGVNITLGLPFIRTSPDHGTALDIAGRGRADAASLLAALDTAAAMAAASSPGGGTAGVSSGETRP